MGISVASKLFFRSEIETTRRVEFAAMANANGKQLLRYCSALLRDYHEAQDVVQTTFLKALSRRDNKDLVPWLYRTSYNHCIDILRKRKWSLFTFVDERDCTESYQMEDGMSDEIRAALGVLTPKDRALVVSRALDDLDYDQLSSIFGASPSTLRKRYERAKKKLAQALREQGLEISNESHKKGES
ncbi:MAG: sigma-70 family RNA polymerase sigma factor [Defluviitaleaceae bacterium]|nr:sigma-70 family RNA polymerase sigma factor [Defluviitaleaceae bacterium]MCL2263853.1 sigma-70 family RNA polymerase sigma factor [Defluviitaleaceae bacterium]